jgi:hypothetical protein
MNAFGVYRVCSKTHLLVLFAGFCRKGADWSIHNTFMLTPNATPKGAFLDILWKRVKYQFYIFWFDPTGVRGHDLPHA